MARKTYGSDLTDKQWKLIEPHIPPEKDFGRPRTTNMREITNALLYMLRTGCQWDMIPEGFPPKSTVNGYFNAWKRDGTLDEILKVLRESVRIKAGHKRLPSASIIDAKLLLFQSLLAFMGLKKLRDENTILLLMCKGYCSQSLCIQRQLMSVMVQSY